MEPEGSWTRLYHRGIFGALFLSEMGIASAKFSRHHQALDPTSHHRLWFRKSLSYRLLNEANKHRPLLEVTFASKSPTTLIRPSKVQQEVHMAW